MGRNMLSHPEYRRLVHQRSSGRHYETSDQMEHRMNQQQMMMQQGMAGFGNIFGLGLGTMNTTECSTFITPGTVTPLQLLDPPCTRGLNGTAGSTGQMTIPYEAAPWPGYTQLELFERPKPPPPPAPEPPPTGWWAWFEHVTAKLPRIKWGDSDEEQP